MALLRFPKLQEEVITDESIEEYVAYVEGVTDVVRKESDEVCDLARQVADAARHEE